MQTAAPSTETRVNSRQAVEVVLPEWLVAKALTLQLDLSLVCERGLVRAVVDAEKGQAWRQGDPDSVEAYNRWIDEEGLPLAEFRQF